MPDDVAFSPRGVAELNHAGWELFTRGQWEADGRVELLLGCRCETYLLFLLNRKCVLH